MFFSYKDFLPQVADDSASKSISAPTPTELCSRCLKVLRSRADLDTSHLIADGISPHGEVRNHSIALHEHHLICELLLESGQTCGLCRLLWAVVLVKYPVSSYYSVLAVWYSEEQDPSGGRELFPAFLFVECEGMGVIPAGVSLKPFDAPRSSSMPYRIFDIVAIVDKIRDWMDECTRIHACVLPQNDYRPRRLLRLEGDSPSDINFRLVSGSDEEEVDGYVTLSHRWGSSGPSLRLTADNFREFETGRLVESLPPIFRDAALIVYVLGYRYLWIDALCIMQGNGLEARQDWQLQAGQMDRVYTYSALTISALSANSDSEEGFLYPILNRVQAACPVDIPFEIIDKDGVLTQTGTRPGNALMQSFGGGIAEVEEAALNRRGWVLQERLLSPRIVYFTGSQIHWECQNVFDVLLTDTEPRNIQELRRDLWRRHSKRKKYQDFLASQHTATDGTNTTAGTTNLLSGCCKRGEVEVHSCEEDLSAISDGFRRSWESLRDTYTECHLTKADDRLPAIMGLVERLKGCTGMANFFGIWLENVHHDLLWCTSSTSARRLNSAPSWSWASCDGPVATFHTALAADFDRTPPKDWGKFLIGCVRPKELSSSQGQPPVLLVGGSLVEDFEIHPSMIWPDFATISIQTRHGLRFMFSNEKHPCLDLSLKGYMIAEGASIDRHTQSVTFRLDTKEDKLIKRVSLLPLVAEGVQRESVESCVIRGLILKAQADVVPSSKGLEQKVYSRIGVFEMVFKTPHGKTSPAERRTKIRIVPTGSKPDTSAEKLILPEQLQQWCRDNRGPEILLA